jgi:hypothetical protein
MLVFEWPHFVMPKPSLRLKCYRHQRLIQYQGTSRLFSQVFWLLCSHGTAESGRPSWDALMRSQLYVPLSWTPRRPIFMHSTRFMVAVVVCLPPIFETFRNFCNGNLADTLQYLDLPDFAKHVKLLAGRAMHFSTDPEYLSTFHRESLQKVKGETKKETRSDSTTILWQSTR